MQFLPFGVYVGTVRYIESSHGAGWELEWLTLAQPIPDSFFLRDFVYIMYHVDFLPSLRPGQLSGKLLRKIINKNVSSSAGFGLPLAYFQNYVAPCTYRTVANLLNCMIPVGYRSQASLAFGLYKTPSPSPSILSNKRFTQMK